ncbi:hypothetical protein [Sphingobacterium sp. DR205]|uniref:hypothetical protein n=1 Tax=Sphingobacterium sp. DR205 TaxID=2713573 RepID=UPI0013E48B00|nr:hypothetical protein [Sphingobacterium sp. DR205]QIH33828.1 hypothetical protein G6053_13470 [Sphingobacterium sp. DR205]
MEKSYGFEVSLNGNKVTRAGISKKNYVVNCIIDSVHRKDDSGGLYMQVSGLDSDLGVHVNWFGGQLKVGDKILVEVIDDGFDGPNSTYKPFSEEEIREQKMKHYLQLKEELKDFLQE